MADANIKKVVIPKSELPVIDGSTFSYNMRYRIVSEDKNRTSHWSKIHQVSAVGVTSVSWHYIKQNLSNSSGGITKSIRFDWAIPVGYENKGYDIFIKKCSSSACTEDYEYVMTSEANNYIFIKSDNETDVQITVQVPTYPKNINTSARLFESTIVNI